MQRCFIDWKLPFIRGAVCEILDKNCLGAVGPQKVDLSPFLFVFPSGRALRRFEETLAREIKKRTAKGTLPREWFPPAACTVGTFPEQLYLPQKPFASKPAELLLWREALRLRNTEILFPNFPKGDFSGELQYARLVANLYHQVASEGLNFTSPHKNVEEKQISLEVTRWQTLCDVQRSFYDLLSQHSLCEKQTERLRAADKKEICSEKKIVLFGTADLNSLQKKILGRLSDKPGEIISFVQAPESKKDSFDEFGCIIPEKWCDEPIAIPDEALVPASDPVDEGEMAARFADLFLASGENRPEKAPAVSIALLDPETRPYLSNALSQLGITFHFGEGKPFAENRVALLLRHTADYLRTRSYSDFAKWIRHPDMESTIRRGDFGLAEEDWLSELDAYQNDNVPMQIEMGAGTSKAAKNGKLRKLFGAVSELLKPLRSSAAAGEEDTVPTDSEFAPLDAFPQRIADYLAQFYSQNDAAPSPPSDGDPDFPAQAPSDGIFREKIDYQIDEGLRILYRTLDELVGIPPELIPTVSAGQAIDFVLRCAAGDIPDEPKKNESVDIHGWLDARFTEGQGVIFVGFNEGIIPNSHSSDPFLPDTVCRELEIENNALRYSRDAYFLTAIFHSYASCEGKKPLRILFAKTSLEKDPQLPSRLLFAADDITIANRISRFFANSPEFPDELRHAAPAPDSHDSAAAEDLQVSPPGTETSQTAWGLPCLTIPDPLPQRMHVTEFGAFLSSPYRYFLERKIGIRSLNDDSQEFNFIEFGNIAHEILCAFAKKEGIKDSEDAREIEKFLCGILDKKMEEYRKVRRSSGTVLLQLEQIKQRLRGFARWQAEWRRAGNEIIFAEEKAEYTLNEKSPYNTPEFEPFTLSGKIDRIDYNRQLDQWFIFDYKTFDTDTPAKDSVKALPEWVAPWPEEKRTLFESLTTTQTEDGEYLLDIGTGNIAETKHCDPKKGISCAVKIESDNTLYAGKYWTNLQLPLYTLLAENLISQETKREPGTETRRKGEPQILRGQNPLALAYIVLKKDNHAKAYLGNWTRSDIDEAVQTARWIRTVIKRLWNGTIDPAMYIDPAHPEYGQLYSPPEGYWRKEKLARASDLLRDFPYEQAPPVQE